MSVINQNPSMDVSISIMKSDGSIKVDKHFNVFSVSVKGEYVVIEIHENFSERKITIKAQDVIAMEVRNHELY